MDDEATCIWLSSAASAYSKCGTEFRQKSLWAAFGYFCFTKQFVLFAYTERTRNSRQNIPLFIANGLNSRSISRRIQSHLVLKLIWQRQRRENCDAWQACLHNATSV